MVRVGGLIQAHYNAEETETPWLTGWHNATVLCVNNKKEITISFDEHPDWGKCLIPTKQTRSRDKAPISAVSVENEIVSQSAEEPVVAEVIPQPVQPVVAEVIPQPVQPVVAEVIPQTVQPIVAEVIPQPVQPVPLQTIPQPIAVQHVLPVAQNTRSLLVEKIPVLLVHGAKKKGRSFPRSIPENELSKLVLKVFRDLKEQDYHLEYAEDVWLEDEDDWETAVEYFDEAKPDRLELRVIIKQKEVPVVAEVVQQKVPEAKVAQQKVPSDIPVMLTCEGEVETAFFPRSFPENGLSDLVLRTFPDLQGKDFYLSYWSDMDTERVDDEHDWESAWQYFEKSSFGISGAIFDVRFGSSESEDEDSGSSLQSIIRKYAKKIVADDSEDEDSGSS